MSAKSNPGDGTHGRGVKGGRVDGEVQGAFSFVVGFVRGLIGLRRR
jgi:hypothetical protein